MYIYNYTYIYIYIHHSIPITNSNKPQPQLKVASQSLPAASLAQSATNKCPAGSFPSRGGVLRISQHSTWAFPNFSLSKTQGDTTDINWYQLISTDYNWYQLILYMYYISHWYQLIQPATDVWNHGETHRPCPQVIQPAAPRSWPRACRQQWRSWRTRHWKSQRTPRPMRKRRPPRSHGRSSWQLSFFLFLFGYIWIVGVLFFDWDFMVLALVYAERSGSCSFFTAAWLVLSPHKKGFSSPRPLTHSERLKTATGFVQGGVPYTNPHAPQLMLNKACISTKRL